MSHSTTVCRKHVAPNPPPLVQNGDFHFQTHHIGFILCGTFAIISTVVSVLLISKHLQWYTNKREQRYIVRLLFMVPLYALISFASFYFWNQSTPIVLVRDSYEAIVLTAFFYLLLMYLSEDPEEQKRVFLKKGLSREADRIATQKGLAVKKWCFPLGFVKRKPSDGLYFLQLMKWAVLQYCVIRPTTTLAAVTLDLVGLYCESSWNPRWGHVYIVVIISISVTIAMYCLIQLYVVVAAELAPHKPLLKLFSIKAVVFLTFWQATFLSLLSMVGVIKDSKYMTAEDINIGIGAVIETFEMMLFAFLHIRAFTYKPYREIAIKAAKGRRPTPTPRWKSLGHAMDFRETFREIWIGCVYMFDKIRGEEPKPDFGARRVAHYEVAFGRSRVQGQNSLPLHGTKRGDKEPKQSTSALPAVEIEVERNVSVEVEGHKRFLGRNDQYEVHPDREKSDGLEDQINHELQRLGYPKLTIDVDPLSAMQNKPPWWRSLYDRLSQSGQETDTIERESFIPRRLSKRFSRSLLLPPPQASPQRNPTGFQDRPVPVPGQGQGHSQKLDRRVRDDYDYDHGGYVQNYRHVDRVGLVSSTTSRDEMVDLSYPRANFDNNGTTGCTKHTTFNPIYLHHHHDAQPSNDNNRDRIFNVTNHDQHRRQGHVHSQLQPPTFAPDPPRSSSSTLPSVPRGALVFPDLPALTSHHDTEFDPWQEHAHSPLACDPTLEINPALNRECHHPDQEEPAHDPPPPAVPPKDIQVPILPRHGRQGNDNVNMSIQPGPVPRRRSTTHRREPALPLNYSPFPSPSPAPSPASLDSSNLLSGLPPPSILSPVSDQDTNRHL